MTQKRRVKKKKLVISLRKVSLYSNPDDSLYENQRIMCHPYNNESTSIDLWNNVLTILFNFNTTTTYCKSLRNIKALLLVCNTEITMLKTSYLNNRFLCTFTVCSSSKLCISCNVSKPFYWCKQLTNQMFGIVDTPTWNALSHNEV